MNKVVCMYSLSTIGKGLSHVCSKMTQLANSATALSHSTKDQINSSTLRKKVQETQSVAVTVATGGMLLRVLVGGAVKRKLDFNLVALECSLSMIPCRNSSQI